LAKKASFRFSRVCEKADYLLEFCENIFNENSKKEEPAYKGMPERMVYESEIWMIGEQIRQEIIMRGKKADSAILLAEILKVIHTKKYRRGRESFVMLLSYFKNDPIVIEELGKLLKDEMLYGFAIKELNKLKEYKYVSDVSEILETEKNLWIKKEAEKYLEKSKPIQYTL
jgi:hypothetical protein